MARVFRWERPRLHSPAEGGGPTTASPDLFYDLIFAVVLAQLAIALAETTDARDLLTFTLLTIATIRLWITQTLYADRFGAVDVSYRLYVFAAMLAGAGLAVGAGSGIGRGFPLFAVSVVVSRALVVVEWLRAGVGDERARQLARRYALFFGIESAFWLAAIFVPSASRLLLISGAVLADLVLPATTTRRQGELGEFSQEHLSDRFVDFYLIVLGQLVIVAILIMTRARQPSASDILAGALSVALAFVLWWVYVDHVIGRPLRRGAFWNAAWVYLHVPLFASAVAFGSGFFTFVAHGERAVATSARLLLCGSFGLAVLFAGLAEIALVPLRGEAGRLERTSLIHLAPATLALMLGGLGRGLTAIPLLALLLLIGLGAVAGGEYLRARL